MCFTGWMKRVVVPGGNRGGGGNSIVWLGHFWMVCLEGNGFLGT